MRKLFNSKGFAICLLVVAVIFAIVLGQKKEEDDFYDKLTDDIRNDTQTDTTVTTVPVNDGWKGLWTAVSAVYSDDFQNIYLYDETGDVDADAIKAIHKLDEKWFERLGLGVMFYINKSGGIDDYEACADELFYDLNLDEGMLLIVISQGDGLFYVCPGCDFYIELSQKQINKLTDILTVDYTRPSELNETIEDVCDYLYDIFDDAYDNMG